MLPVRYRLSKFKKVVTRVKGKVNRVDWFYGSERRTAGITVFVTAPSMSGVRLGILHVWSHEEMPKPPKDLGSVTVSKAFDKARDGFRCLLRMARVAGLIRKVS